MLFKSLGEKDMIPVINMRETGINLRLLMDKKGISVKEVKDYLGLTIGMIKVDGLEPTKDFKEYIEKEKRGEVTMEDAKRFLDKKYKMKE